VNGIQAADLPVGTIVEFTLTNYRERFTVRRIDRDDLITWCSLPYSWEFDGPLGGTLFFDSDVQRELDDGAKVLRVGDGNGR
jgi:hypothetical protein